MYANKRNNSFFNNDFPNTERATTRNDQPLFVEENLAPASVGRSSISGSIVSVYSCSTTRSKNSSSSKNMSSISSMSSMSSMSSGSSGSSMSSRAVEVWTVDESEQRERYKLKKHISVDPVMMNGYYLWRRLIREGKHPRDAAAIAGQKFNFKQTKQKSGIQVFSIRLGLQHRVYFTLQEKERIVKIISIGGHTLN